MAVCLEAENKKKKLEFSIEVEIEASLYQMQEGSSIHDN